MNKKIKFLKSNSFGNKKISYGFFTRNGGKSKKPFNTLNCSRKNGDSLLNVRNNFKLAMKSLKLEKNKSWKTTCSMTVSRFRPLGIRMLTHNEASGGTPRRPVFE